MQFPWHLDIGSVAIPLHPILETLGIFIGFRYFLYLRKNSRDNIATSRRIYIIAGALFGAVAGSRIVGGLENIPAMLHSENILLHFYTNKTIVGGLLGGLVGVELMKRMINERRSSGDLFTFPILLAMIIGRVGCFSMGVFEDTVGTITDAPTAMDLGDGQLRHPVVLYEIFFLAMLWLMLAVSQKRIGLAEGALFKVFMIAYLLFRFLLDFIKPHYTWHMGLSTIQITCVAGLVYYITFIVKPKKLLAAYA